MALIYFVRPPIIPVCLTIYFYGLIFNWTTRLDRNVTYSKVDSSWRLAPNNPKLLTVFKGECSYLSHSYIHSQHIPLGRSSDGWYKQHWHDNHRKGSSMGLKLMKAIRIIEKHNNFVVNQPKGWCHHFGYGRQDAGRGKQNKRKGLNLFILRILITNRFFTILFNYTIYSASK